MPLNTLWFNGNIQKKNKQKNPPDLLFLKMVNDFQFQVSDSVNDIEDHRYGSKMQSQLTPSYNSASCRANTFFP